MYVQDSKSSNSDKYIFFLPDSVTSSHPDPVGNWTILLQLFCQFGLDTESLVSRL